MKNVNLRVENYQKRMPGINKMAAGRHLEFDKLVPPAHTCPSGSLFRTPWATSVPNFSSSLKKKRTFISRADLPLGWVTISQKRVYLAAIFSAICCRVTSFVHTNASVVSNESIFYAAQKWFTLSYAKFQSKGRK